MQSFSLVHCIPTVGEDVEHGGYYLVTEGLAKKHSSYRVRDYPPDETTLLGSAMGLAQAGLLPVVEVGIPYPSQYDIPSLTNTLPNLATSPQNTIQHNHNPISNSNSTYIYLNSHIRSHSYYLFSYSTSIVTLPPHFTHHHRHHHHHHHHHHPSPPPHQIPYAKYLDCAADMFFEAVNTYWLSNGSYPPSLPHLRITTPRATINK